jgi:hypothetical protein
VGVGMSAQAAKIPGPGSNARQLVVRRIGWKDNKQNTEMEAVEKLCKFTERSSWKIEPRKENDSTDITARSSDGTTSEDFQVVRLWEQNDWRELNTKDAVDRCYSDQEAVDLFRKALTGKGAMKYPNEVRKKLTLLIDANPIARPSDFVDGLENSIAHLAQQAGYKEVWVVGTTDALQLAPSLRRTAVVS